MLCPAVEWDMALNGWRCGPSCCDNRGVEGLGDKIIDTIGEFNKKSYMSKFDKSIVFSI